MPEDSARSVVDISDETSPEEEDYFALREETERNAQLSGPISPASLFDPFESGHKKPGKTVRNS